ncbi:hypothetical protein BH18ACT12_BH18ACT12_13170 [soil metagenome]
MGQPSSACRLARGRLSVHLDGELSEFEQVALEGHLTGCARCREYGAWVADVSTQLRLAPVEQPEFPVVLPHRSRIRVPLRTAQVAAAAAVVAVVGFTAAGVPTGGERSVSLHAPNTLVDRVPGLTPSQATRAASGVVSAQRRTAPRPVRGGVKMI